MDTWYPGSSVPRAIAAVVQCHSTIRCLGELTVLAVQGVAWLRDASMAGAPPPLTGDLLLTNYRLLFSGTEPRGAHLTIPLTDIHATITRANSRAGACGPLVYFFFKKKVTFFLVN